MKFLHQWRGVFFNGSNISRMPDKTPPSTGNRALGMLNDHVVSFCSCSSF
jgi:hypothetical protein